MLRKEHNAAEPSPGDIVDAVFAISCRSLPVDHAYALSQAILAALPWFAAEPCAGLHTIRAAESGSGWMRPEDPHSLLHLSQRTRLMLRLPKHRLDDAAALLGRTLDVAGHALRVDRLSVRPLSRITTLLAHCVLLAGCDDESEFRLAATAQLDTLGIQPEEMLCGLTTSIATPERTLRTRSLMLSGLTRGQSALLQQQGLGAERRLGCGLFIPHKAIGDLRARSD
jgi:CRISPR-associated protein Cas6